MSVMPMPTLADTPSPQAQLVPPEARFVPMNIAQLDEVMRVERTAYAWPWSERNMIDSIQHGYRCMQLISRAGLLGYTVAMRGVEEVHLLNLTVSPTFQRQGWARVLLQDLADWSRAQNAQWLWLEVRVSNTRARQVYERFGFRLVSIRKAYYPLDGSRREDAAVMNLALN